MSWFNRNAAGIEAGAALVTALVAVLALVGVKLQIDASQLQAQEQGARDLYREHLALSMQYPQYADPGTCPAFSENEDLGYAAYVTHLIYTAEETIAADPSWWPVMSQALELHAPFFCEYLGAETGLTDPVRRMLGKIAVQACAEMPACT